MRVPIAPRESWEKFDRGDRLEDDELRLLHDNARLLVELLNASGPTWPAATIAARKEDALAGYLHGRGITPERPRGASVDAARIALPWPEPVSVYDSDGPRDGLPVEFGVGRIKFRVAGTDALAPSTFRTRYLVECLTCGAVLHEATTGPSCRVEAHLRDSHGIVGEVSYAG